MGYRGRDVEVSFADDTALVAAVDSSAAIGEKEFDVVRVPAKLTGRFATRVALLEVLAAGAEPRIVTAAICSEPDPTGNMLLKGVREELKSAGLGKLPIVISCEKNMPTRQTGLGITVVGMIERAGLRIAGTRDGDNLFCLGLPKVGPEVHDANDSEIVQANDVRNLLKDPAVHDIVPVGSQGILGEINQLCAAVILSFILGPPRLVGKGSGNDKMSVDPPDMNKSGGPGTCLIFSAAPGFVPRNLPAPLFYLGRFAAGRL